MIRAAPERYGEIQRQGRMRAVGGARQRPKTRTAAPSVAAQASLTVWPIEEHDGVGAAEDLVRDAAEE
jgi:hypothetical protein